MAAPAQRLHWLKAQLADDIRLVQYPLEEGLAGLRAAIARKWAEEPVPLIIKSVAVPQGEGDQGQEAAAGVAPGTTIVTSDQLVATLTEWSAAARMPRVRLVRPGEDGEAPYDSGLLDEWILDLAALVRDHLGLDAESHLDMQNQGVDLCNAALSDATTPAEAGPQFQAAEAKLRDAAAYALDNWGTVHMCLARKRLEGGV